MTTENPYRQENKPAYKLFEYYHNVVETDSLNDFLHCRGEEGCELISVCRIKDQPGAYIKYRCFFKRPKY
jgi:hypothetical protein